MYETVLVSSTVVEKESRGGDDEAPAGGILRGPARQRVRARVSVNPGDTVPSQRFAPPGLAPGQMQ